VLVKVPHHRPARQADLAALEREFTLLKTLPGEITRAIALLRQGGYYALVFEDTTGVLLSKLCDVGPLDLAATLAIAIQITTALAELHRRDLIHGDISPEAILVDPTGWRARLIDFSNTRRASAKMQTLSSPDLPLSPLQYASPEQTGRMNRSVDYRTDFYSLGVMLYQLLTGTCPFRSDDPLALVHAHIAKNPVTPSELNSRIPKALDQVLMKLLGKTAEERYQSTLGLRTDLEHCAKQWAEKGAISPFSLGNQDVSDRFILPQHLYGRERQLDELLETFDKVCEGRSALLLVSGYSGVGKTTLIQELYKPLVRQRGYFINGKFEQLERNIPYQALLQAFRRLVQRWLTEGEERLNTWRVEIETALGGNGGVLAEMLPEIELILGRAVFLELHVKVKPRWRRDEALLQRLGL